MARLPLVSPLDRALFLKAQPYFGGLPPNLLALLASHGEEAFFPAGSFIRRADDPIDTIHFFGSGRLAVEHVFEDGRAHFEIEPPGAIGLADHLARTPAPPAARALVDTFCLTLSTTDLDQILEDHFPLVHTIARASCDSIVEARKALAMARSDEPGFDAADRIDTPIVLDLVQRLARARRAPLLEGTNLTLLAELIRLDEPETIAPGEPVWSEGDPIDRMTLILDGRFRTNGRFGTAFAGAGAMLGGFEIAATGPRFEGWVAEVPSRILSIDRELFVDLLEDHFEFAQAYLRRLSEQVALGVRARARLSLEKDRMR
ncbi:MAG: cyclic nucleotide-binding domain-containing protein [Myxococcota bacterium]